MRTTKKKSRSAGNARNGGDRGGATAAANAKAGGAGSEKVSGQRGARAKQYIEDVLAGRIVVGKWVRLAVERHVRDLEEGHQRGLRFSEKRGDRAIRFYSHLKHSKVREWAGKPFELSGWQAFIIWCVFGWLRADGTRRFRTAYNEIARKNGKSTFAAGIGLQLLTIDKETGAEIYTAATKRKQARIVHSEAVRMVRASPPLKAIVGIQRDSLHVLATNSTFEPLGADGDTEDGLNISGAIIDELHAHPNRDMLDVLETATGARSQPLIFIITTAGKDEAGICREMRDFGLAALERTWPEEVTDEFFAFIATIDEGDDWTDETVWPKANPNLGISVKWDTLRKACREAQKMPGARYRFLCKHLNVWREQDEIWLPPPKWDACGVEKFDPATLKGRRCYGGLDLSSKIDLTAWVLVFPPDDGDKFWRVLPRFWIPEERIVEREDEDRQPYNVWVEKELIQTTPGNVVDYNFIKKDILADRAMYDLVDLGFDAWSAHQTANDLQADGISCFDFRQGYKSLSEPSKELERLVIGEQLRHNDHQVLTWNSRCAAIKQDENQNIRPVKPKRKSGKRIDGIVALVMAIGRAILAEKQSDSVYEKRGLRVL